MSTRSPNTRALVAATLLACGAVGTSQAAPTLWPNTAIPSCDGSATGTLQDCLNTLVSGAADQGLVSVVIVGSVENPGLRVIDQNIVLNLSRQVSLSLEAAKGVDAVFTRNHSVQIATQGSIPSGSVVSVALKGLTLNHGSLSLVHAITGAGDVAYTVERLRIDSVPNGSCGIALRGEPDSAASSFDVRDNVVQSVAAAGEPGSRGICLSGNQQSRQTVTIERNRIESLTGGFVAGIDLSGSPGSVNPAYLSIRGEVRLLNNQVRGGGRVGSAIRFLQIPTAGSVSTQVCNNVITGWAAHASAIGDPTQSAGIQMSIYDGLALLMHNTIVDGGNGISLVHSTIDSMTRPLLGSVTNNLIGYQTHAGMSLGVGEGDDISGANNLLFQTAANRFPDSIRNTLTSNPQLHSHIYPKPLRGSPAINAGASLPIFTSTGNFDADGEFRYVSRDGSFDIGAVDIGAYEFNGDQAWQQGAEAHLLDGPLLTLAPPAFLPHSSRIVGNLHVQGNARDAHNQQILGTFNALSPPGANFKLFFEDQSTPIPPGQRFNLIASTDYPSKPSVYCISSRVPPVVIGTRVCNNLFGLHTNSDRAITVALHRFDTIDGISTVAHNRPIGLSYLPAMADWFVTNEDAPPALMPDGLVFNITAVHEGSPNGFSAQATDVESAQIRLDHPLLDNNPCAAPVAGFAWIDGEFPAASLNAGTALALHYRTGTEGAPGHWYAVATRSNSALSSSATAFVPYQKINVILDGAQANRCRLGQDLSDELFRNGFE